MQRNWSWKSEKLLPSVVIAKEKKITHILWKNIYAHHNNCNEDNVIWAREIIVSTKVP